MTRARRCSVIGLGSDHGDDAIGWAAIDALAACGLPPGTSLHTCATPAADLLSLLAACEHAVIVDAVADNEAPGRVRRLDLADLAASSARGGSHGMSVAAVLALADALQLAPRTLVLVGVGIDPRRTLPGQPLSPPLRAVLPALVAELLATLEESTTKALP